MSESGPGGAERARSGTARGQVRGLSLIGIGVAAVCLAWVFHDVDVRAVVSRSQAIHWGWVGVAVLLDVAGYVAQGWRWSLLLPRGRRPGIRRATQAIYAGLFVNELLPVRPGELLRAYLVRRWTGAAIGTVLASILVERLIDGAWLAVAVALLAILVPLPRYLVNADEILAIVVLLGAGCLAVLLWRGRRSAAEAAPAGRWRQWLASLKLQLDAAGIGPIGAAFAISPLVPLLEALALWSMMRAYALPVTIGVGVAVMLIIRLGTAVPTAPGNLGTYQFLCVVGLTLFGVDKAAATGFSVVAFVLLTAPLLAIGFVAFGASGLTLRRLPADLDASLDAGRSP